MENTQQRTQQRGDSAFRLKFEGKMTYQFYGEQKGRAIDAMQRHKEMEIDLSAVDEIDLHGLHLLGLLQGAGLVVAVSPVVERAAMRLLSTHHAAALGRVQRHRTAAINQ